MSVDGVEAKVKEVFEEILGVSESDIVPTARLVEDLQVSSIDQVDILAEFENAFGIDISSDDSVKITTVGEMTDYLKAKVKQRDDD